MTDDAPAVRIVAGDPDAEELAVVVALVTRRRATPVDPSRQFSLWSRKSRSIRPVLRPGFGAWRASTMPR
jgi:hypothetical protein